VAALAIPRLELRSLFTRESMVNHGLSCPRPPTIFFAASFDCQANIFVPKGQNLYDAVEERIAAYEKEILRKLGDMEQLAQQRLSRHR
jgi:hypothetical protein